MVETVCRFNQESGPLILLTHEALAFWEGNDPPSGGRVIQAISRWDDQEDATDYDRACDVMAWSEVLLVGPDSWGLVLPEDAGGIVWLSLDDTPDTFALVQSLRLDTDTLSGYPSLFEEAMEDTEGWTSLQNGLTVCDGALFLMPAASRGDEVREVAWNREARIGTAQVLQIPGGTYSFDQYVLPSAEDKETEAGVVFTRLQRLTALPEAQDR